MKSGDLTCEKSQALLWLVENRPADLQELLEGESQHTLPTGPFVADLPREQGRAWTMALHHVRFAARFGLLVPRVIEGSMTYAAFPEEFNHWLHLGAPGLSIDELASYLAAKPIPHAS